MSNWIQLKRCARLGLAGPLIASFVFGFSAWATVGFAQEKITFDDHAKPILRQRCASCHNPNKKSGGLDLTNFTNLMQGGSSGDAIEPGDSGGSYLFMLVTHDEEPVMPPSGTKIPENEIKLLANWIDGGALENKTSIATVAKPSFEMAAGTNPNVRPEVIPLPPRMSLEPALIAQRPSNATAIATSPWAPLVAVGMAKQVLLYDSTTMKLRGVLPFPEGQVYKLKFSRSGTVLVAGGGKDGASGLVVGWDVRTGERAFQVGDELDAVMAADISTDHSMVALGGPSKMVRVFSTRDGTLLYEIKKHTEWVTAIEFSPDGVLLATGDRNGGLHVWEAETGNEYLTLKGHTKQISGVSWRSDGNILASASEDTTGKLWEMENGRQVKSWGAHGGGSTYVDFTRDGNVLTSGRDKKAKLWKQDGSLVHQFDGLNDIVVACAYCDESGRVLAGDWSGRLAVWNAADKSLLGELATNPMTLQSRLDLAIAKQTQLNGEHAAHKNTFTGLESKLNELNANFQSASAGLQAAQSELSTTESELATTNKQMETTTVEQTKLQAELKANGGALPLLKESLAKTQEALKSLPNDVEIQEAAKKLQVKVVGLEAEMARLEKGLQESLTLNTSTQSKLAQLKSLFGQRQSKMSEMTKKVNELQAQKVDLEKQVIASKATLDAAAAAVASANGQVQRWQGELQFVQQLNSLYADLESAETEFVAQAELAAEAKRQAELAAESAEKAKVAEAEAKKKWEAIQQKIYGVKGIGN